MPKSASTKWIAIAGVVGFVLLLGGMAATAWFLSKSVSSDDPVGPSDTEAAGAGKSSCQGLSISTSTVDDINEQVTLSATGSDADGPLSSITIYAAVNGQKNNSTNGPCSPSSSYYCNNANSWLAIATTSGNTISKTITFEEVRAQLAAHSQSTGLSFDGSIKDKGIVFVVNTVGEASNDLCSSNIAMYDGNGAYYGNDEPHWTESCTGGCVQRLIFDEPPPITDLVCNEVCENDSQCSGSLICDESAGRCREPNCSTATDCICDTGSPSFSAAATISTAQCTTHNGQPVGRVTYTVSTRNSGDKSGNIRKLEIDLDSRMGPTWVDQSSLGVGGVLTSDGNGTKITWDEIVGLAVVQPGGVFQETFVVNVPQASFGNFSHVVTGYPDDSSLQSFTHNGTVQISCYVPVSGLPSTGIFDSTESKLLGAGFMIALSALLIGLESTDRGVVNFLTGSGRFVNRVQVKYSKEEREKRAVKRNREEFEDRIKN